MRHPRVVVALCLAATLTPTLAPAQRPPATRPLTGVVRDAATGAPLGEAQVTLAGAAQATTTDSAGRYRLLVPRTGEVRVRARRIGYRADERVVPPGEDAAAVLDFRLERSAVNLDQVVVTATGERERLRESGSAVGLVHTDSVPLAAVTSFTDLLSSRVAGVNVQQSSGTSGTGARIRVRGWNSISLTNEPLLLVDGVRVNATPNSLSIGIGGQRPTRFNDLDPDEIERVEILRGPAASALYGTAASNGVVQVTTRRGRPGAARWTAFAERGTIHDVTAYPANVAQIGTTAAGTRTGACTLEAQVRRQCTPIADSLVAWNPLEQASPFRAGWQDEFGGSVGGGGSLGSYHLTAQTGREQGVVAPNALRSTSVRASATALLGGALRLTVTAGGVGGSVGLPRNGVSVGYMQEALSGRAVDDPVRRGYSAWAPAQIFAIDTRQDTRRYTGGLTAEWAPRGWLRAVATAGVDDVSLFDRQTAPPGIVTTAAFGDGLRISNRTELATHSATAGVTATARPTAALEAQTSAGVQWFRERARATEATGRGLLAGTAGLAGATTGFAVSESDQDVVTAGAYVQQRLAWRDRLFVTAALRGDDNSAFGPDFGLVAYPSASVSWVASEEPFFPRGTALSSLRLRAAWGVSGQRPNFRSADRFFRPVAVNVNGVEVPAITIGAAGNVGLRPERTSEGEVGLDAALLGARLTLGLTLYDKRTRDALLNRPLAPSLGVGAARVENVGRVSNRGLELTAGATLVDRARLRWEVAVAGSANRNRVVDLGPGVAPIIQGFITGMQRQQAGYPIGAFFQRPIVEWADRDGDGIVSRVNCPGAGNPQMPGGPACEVTLGDTAVYLGTPIPVREANLSTSATLARLVRLSALVNYQGGHRQFNTTRAFRCGAFQNCREVHDARAPLADQARAVANLMGSYAGYVEDRSFARLREVAVTLLVPARLARRVGTRDLQLTLAGRNLALWTRYSGFDPEVTINGQAEAGAGQADFMTQPAVRHLTLRLTTGF